MKARVFANAVDIDGRPLEFSVSNGRFAEIAPKVRADEGVEIIDLQGRLVLPGFVDGHIHLDKSFIGDRWHPHQTAGSLRERLAVEKRELASASPAAERADALIRRAASFGTIAMRSHVDVDATVGLDNLHAVMEVREKWRGFMDIELVAFPQAGVMTCPGTAELLDAGIAEGAEVVGGIDPTAMDADAERQLDVIFGIAEKRGAKIDIHLHEHGQQGIEQLHRVAARTRALCMHGRVAVSHAYALGEVAPDVVDTVAAALVEAGVSVMTNAPGNHAFPPVLRLREVGVRMFTGNDNIQDAWWPYGNGDMLQRAMLVGYRSGFYTDESLRVALDMATDGAASVLGIRDYGLRVGNAADFIAVDAPNGAAAVAAAPAERTVVRRGVFWKGLRQPRMTMGTRT